MLPHLHPTCAQASFGIITLMCSMPTWAVAKIGLMIVDRLPESQRPAARAALNRIALRCLNWSWWLAATLSYWVRYRCSGLSELRRGLNAAQGKPRCLLLNHLSFFDTILGVSCLPFRAMADLKALSAMTVFKMPIMGTIVRGCGHIPVPFKKPELDANFEIAKADVVKVQQQMDEHVRNGGLGCWFPEGTLNLGDGLQIMQFRAGGFALPASVDCEIWCICALGNAVMWPKKAAVGGLKSNIGVAAFRLCESSFDLCASAEVPEGVSPERARALHLANKAQTRFQEELDKMSADGWCSVPKLDKS